MANSLLACWGVKIILDGKTIFTGSIFGLSAYWNESKVEIKLMYKLSHVRIPYNGKV